MSIRRVVVALVVLAACTTTGAFEGDLAHPRDAGAGPPPPRHEHVEFTWASEDGGLSGTMRAVLPDQRVFEGEFREITRTTHSSSVDGFYGSWYGGWWYGPGWYWGGAWPYYSSVDNFVVHYTGKVVATLDDHAGTHMRCRFELDDSEAGIGTGGEGECQLSNGDRITAWFGRNQTQS